MTDQIKIIVVATGFDEGKAQLARLMSRAKPVQHLPQGIVSDLPTRRQEPVKDEKKPTPPIIEEEPPAEIPEEEFGGEFDIPAFLRQGK
jgi:hypothetical protein